MSGDVPAAAPRPTGPWALRAARWRAAAQQGMPGPQRINRRVLVALLAGASVVLFVMRRPPYPSDSLAYFQWAGDIGGNQVHHGTTRLGMLLPVRAAIALLGTSEAAYYLVPLLMALLLIGGTYVVGSRIAGTFAGAGAAIAMTGSLLVLEYTSQILPDPFAAAWFVAGIACFLTARSSPRRTWWMAAGAGAVGMAYLCREYVVFLAPLVLFLAWTTGWRRDDWIAVGTVLLGVLAVEIVLMVVFFGDPLARVRALTGFAGRVTSGESDRLVAYGEGAGLLTVLSRTPVAFAHYAMGILLGLGGLAGVGFLVFDRARRWLWGTLLVWIGSLWAPMMVLAGIFDPAHPRIRDNRVRYWFLVVPALYLLLAAVATVTARLMRRRRMALMVLVTAAVLVVGAAGYDVADEDRTTAFHALGATQWNEVRAWLRDDGAGVDRIYLDDRMATVLPFYTRGFFGGRFWDGEIVVFDDDGVFLPVSEMHGALVLHELGLRFLANDGIQVPADYLDPGPGWQVEVRRDDGSLTILRDEGA